MNDRAHVLVVADGEVDREALVRLSAAPAGRPMVIAADGGAALLSVGVRRTSSSATSIRCRRRRRRLSELGVPMQTASWTG
jgi:hypothetical protein